MILWTFRIVFISVCLKQFSCSPVLRCHVLLALMAFRDPCFMFTKASVCAALPLDLPVFPRMCLISCCGLVPFQDCWGKLASNAVWSSGRIEFWAFFSISCLKSISCFLHKVWHSDIEQAWMGCDSQTLWDAAVCTNVTTDLPWEVTGQQMTDQPPPANICDCELLPAERSCTNSVWALQVMPVCRG